MMVIKWYEFHALDIDDNTDRLVGIVKSSSDLRVIDGYFQVFSPEDYETIIGVRADQVAVYRLVPIKKEVNHNAT